MTKKEISEILGVDQNTIKNWERNRPKLHEIVIEYFNEAKIYPDLDNHEYLKKETIKAIEQMPKNKMKKFYHLMMAELADMGI
jgi:transcriptional regulator with XRE-family HTH domain